MAEGLSGYESPSYIYGSVFTFFLIMSILIEKGLDFVEHRLKRLNRNGLNEALNSIIKEVMMLGFISLFLIAVEDQLAEICVNKFTHDDNWILISHVAECDACLEDTKSLSDQYKEDHHCPFWEDQEDDTHRRRLLATGGDAVCSEGEEPLVSKALLHEVHLAIFLLALIHASNVILMVLLASWKLNRWSNWKQSDDKYALCVSATLNTVTLEPLDNDNSENEVPEVRVDGEVKDPSTTASEAATIDSKEITPSLEQADKTKTIKNSGCVLKILIPASSPAPSNSFRKVVRWPVEWLISFFKQFINAVTQEEFRIMRAAFMLEHHRTRNFDFIEYLTKALDDDICMVVKMPVAGWVALILVLTFWAPITYTGWIFTAFTILFVFFVTLICTKLVTVVRHVTREGRINKLEPEVFWFKNPKLLLPVVRFTLFINSAIFALMATLAIQYGARSCHFYGEEDNADLHYWSWIAILLLNLFSFLHISLIMLPTYSLVVHMGSTHWSHHLISDNVKNKLLDLRNKVSKDRAAGGASGHQR